jgi:hypothetical protein
MRKTELKQKTPLKAKTNLKATTKKRKKSPKTLLKKSAWEWFSRYVRLRDSEFKEDGWYGTCITCSKTGRVAWIDDKSKLRFVRGWDAGHYITRGNWYLRHDEENVNLQCSFHCNKMKSGNLEKYKPALDLKYGDGTRKKLDKEARNNPTYNPPSEELEQVVHDAKEYINYMTEHAV